MSKLHMGHRSYGEPILRGDLSDVYVGKYCSIAQNVIMDCGWHHNVDFVTTYPLNAFFPQLNHITSHPKTKGDIHIGNDVWIGEGAVIMSGVHIGDGAIIGARSVVTSDVPNYTIFAGSPARMIRDRFYASQVNSLLAMRWWDWPEERIIANGELLMSKDIDNFIKNHK